MMKKIDKFQSEKPYKSIDDGDRISSPYDSRFSDYAEALKNGDTELCVKMRQDNVNQCEIIAKFDTLERMWLSLMGRYVREIQILRREREGYRNLAEGHRKTLENDRTLPQVRTHLRRGAGLLSQAEAAREDHEEVEVLVGFAGVA